MYWDVKPVKPMPDYRLTNGVKPTHLTKKTLFLGSDQGNILISY